MGFNVGHFPRSVAILWSSSEKPDVAAVTCKMAPGETNRSWRRSAFIVQDRTSHHRESDRYTHVRSVCRRWLSGSVSSSWFRRYTVYVGRFSDASDANDNTAVHCVRVRAREMTGLLLSVND